MFTKFTSKTNSYLQWEEKHFITKELGVINPPKATRFYLLGGSDGTNYTDSTTTYTYAASTDRSLIPAKTKWIYGSGNNYEVNAFYFTEVQIADGDTYDVDFYNLTKPFLNYTITQSWNKIKVLAIENINGSGSLDIGNSGVVEPLDLFGYDTEIGPSGVYTMQSKTGIPVSSTANSISLKNRNPFPVTIRLFVMGNK
mgnify:CR=1 FL=1